MDFSDVKEAIFTFVVDQLGAALAAKFDDQIWPDAKHFVSNLLDVEEMTGTAKHAQVSSQLNMLFGESFSKYAAIATTIVDVFIKLAYIYVAISAGKAQETT